VATIARRMTDAAARLVLTPSTVAAVHDAGEFRTIELAGEKLRGAQWVPGDKVRIRAENFALRTYTPIGWDSDAGNMRILAYAHGAGPGSDWCAGAAPGVACELRGPERSVRLDRVEGPVAFVGDETSFGLLLAWLGFRPDAAPVAARFEVANEQAARSVLDASGAAAELLARAADETHRAELAREVGDVVRAHPDVTLVLTGRAQTIAAIRRQLKAEGVAPRATIAKAYWDERRKGLD
jgi:ferric-chelate reductase (NADPH)